MAEEISYYAIVNDLSSIDRPAGVLRRIKSDGGERDETFGTNLTWGRSALLYAYERGDLTNDLIPISKEEADRIVARIRSRVAGNAGPPDGRGV